ncbi:glucosaminidase domain-containing protein [Parabacteroides sp. PF5-6]|uniref:glucosaminidase domain-containing protein n=1 Tax=Parabacteroides sp. PF5-6 TaxID=1742403 RepID=UPI0024071DD1|nr:glucosaminidase domain-containing protein [Parabacteroides sp. PF5-6]MDF9830850.1 flagellum-specific peptidoglycan hydrolase FlgJ [Parabacteroides sp. PF5-6]
MTRKQFISRYRTEAERAGQTFDMHPVVILAQAAFESAWGESILARVHNNLFGLTAYGTPNDYWHGGRVSPGDSRLPFRKYGETALSFLDYARLLRQHYPRAADLSPFPAAFAKEIAYSRYISEVNGDNREAYRRGILQISQAIAITINN